MNAGEPDRAEATRLIEAERAQIGHEIHDVLVPLIFAASAGVSNLQGQSPEQQGQPPEQKGQPPEQFQGRLNQINGWLQEALRTARQLLTQIYPPELAGKPWTRAAQETIERLFPEPEFTLDWRVDEDALDVPPEVALATYRIVVEAVRNAVAHGQATSIRIVAEQFDSGARVAVTDNGSGFDPDQLPADRYGIRSMRGRAQLVGGTLKIDSRPGGPTAVVLQT